MNKESITSLLARGYKRIAWKRWLLRGIALGLTGCSPPFQYEAKEISERHYADGTERMREIRARQHQTTWTHASVPWVQKQPLALTQPERLPKEFAKELLIASSQTLDLKSWCAFFLGSSGLAVRFTPDAEAKLKGLYELETTGSGTGSGSSGRSSSRSSSKSRQGEDSQDYLSRTLSRQSYEGSVENCLDAVAADLGLSWRYREGQIEFYFLATRVFTLHAIATETSASTSVSSGATAEVASSSQQSISSQTSGASSAQSSNISVTLNPVEDIKKNVEQLLTPGIGRYALSSATGSLTVTDTEEVLVRIGEYIDKENRSITRQILLNVKLLTVSLTNSEQVGINWDAILKVAQREIKLGKAAQDSDISVAFGSIGNASGNFYIENFTLFLSALAEQGQVTVLTSPSVVTLNLHPVPIQVGQQENYVARATTTSTGSGEDLVVNSSLEPGTVTTGLSMNLLPYIMDNNEVLLQFSVNLSELISIDSLGDSESNGKGEASDSSTGSASKLQLPKVENRIFSQKVKIGSGKTLVLTGFEQQSDSSKQTSPMGWMKWFSGTGSNDKKNSCLLILITPVILD